jgi:hypothetical protein
VLGGLLGGEWLRLGRDFLQEGPSIEPLWGGDSWTGKGLGGSLTYASIASSSLISSLSRWSVYSLFLL